jgi:hypothetical protein
MSRFNLALCTGLLALGLGFALPAVSNASTPTSVDVSVTNSDHTQPVYHYSNHSYGYRGYNYGYRSYNYGYRSYYPSYGYNSYYYPSYGYNSYYYPSYGYGSYYPSYQGCYWGY